MPVPIPVLHFKQLVMIQYKSLRSFYRHTALLVSMLLFTISVAFAQGTGWKDFAGQWQVSPGNDMITITVDDDQAKQISFDFSGLNLKN